MNTTRQETKKIRASKVREGMSLLGQRITRIDRRDFYGPPRTNPWTQITFILERTGADDEVVQATYGSSEWVEVDR